MRVLLAIFTAHRYDYSAPNTKDWFSRPVADRVQGIRDTWLKDVRGDYKFFYGQGGTRSPKDDEVYLSAPDDYHHSAEKLRALIRYAIEKDYDYLMKVDDDVWVYYDRLIENFPTADYVGSPRIDFAPGFAYGLSRKAMQVLVSSPAGSWAEDRWCGESLKKKQIFCTPDTRYYLVPPTRTNQYIGDEELGKPNNYLAIHSLSPEQMRRLYGLTKSAQR